jgi:hypothetical protein
MERACSLKKGLSFYEFFIILEPQNTHHKFSFADCFFYPKFIADLPGNGLYWLSVLPIPNFWVCL